METEFNCLIQNEVQTQKDEFFNLKDKECQKAFKKYTSKTDMLSKIFDKEGDLNELTEKFIKKLNGCIAQTFKKIRVSGRKRSNIETLHKKLTDLKEKDDEASMKEVIQIKTEIAKHAAENYYNLKTQLKEMETKDGGLNQKQLWKLKKKLCPDSRDPPNAMLDEHENLLTSNKAIQERAIKVFTERLEANPIEDHLKEFEDESNKLCEARLKACKSIKTAPWDEADLKEVLKQLDNNKSRDPEGFAHEIFKEDVAGTDLLQALLKLMNLMKEKQVFPKVLEKCNITTIHKKKSKSDFQNYRGVFRVTILRSILDRLVYNSSYETVDSHLTDGNVGARKRRGCRDNMFVLSAVNNKAKAISAKLLELNLKNKLE